MATSRKNVRNCELHFSFKALDCQLIQELLCFLDSPATDYEKRALIVKALKAMEASLAHGEKVTALLRASPVWKQFEAQKHDLFIKSDTAAAAALTAAPPGVAGYLTATAAAQRQTQAPGAPPPMMDEEPAHNNSLFE